MGRSVTLVRHHPTVGSPRGTVSAAEWSTWLGNEDERGIEPTPIPASLPDTIGASRQA